ncbi:MAG: DUF1570 domain-containing protein [Pirellulales bacterium]
MRRPFITLGCAFAVLNGIASAPSAQAQTPASRALKQAAPEKHAQLVERVSFRDKNEIRSLAGRILVEAADGGLLLETDDGVLWTIEPAQITSRSPTTTRFTPVTREEMAQRLSAELPPGFSTYTTPHYVIAYNTSRVYAQWNSSLLERLHRAFTNYWEREGLAIREPEFPLAVLVFADHQAYAGASRDDLPGGVGNILGYYSLRTNRINMFDLTGAEALRDQQGRRGTLRDINAMLSQPAAVPLVSTIVHEATHQIAFNCGLQTRYADLPLWLLEGMAVYFEAPDLTSTRGWTGIGKVNYPRLETFRTNQPRWNERSLTSLLADDRRFRDARNAGDAYADAWALNYYLIKYQSKPYAAYLKMLAQKPPLVDSGPQARLAEFRQHFGDLEKLEQDFLKRMSRVE